MENNHAKGIILDLLYKQMMENVDSIRKSNSSIKNSNSEMKYSYGRCSSSDNDKDTNNNRSKNKTSGLNYRIKYKIK